LLLNRGVLDALLKGNDPDGVIVLANGGITEFSRRRAPHLLYQ